jgi:hypothetical protein
MAIEGYVLPVSHAPAGAINIASYIPSRSGVAAGAKHEQLTLHRRPLG